MKGPNLAQYIGRKQNTREHSRFSACSPLRGHLRTSLLLRREEDTAGKETSVNVAKERKQIGPGKDLESYNRIQAFVQAGGYIDNII